MYRTYSIVVYYSKTKTLRTLSSVARNVQEARLLVEKSLQSSNDSVISVYPGIYS